MASAVLANRNDLDWPKSRGSSASGDGGGGVGGGFMGKIPFTNPNPNPKSKFSKKKKSYGSSGELNGYLVDESPVVTQSASDDAASSINRRSSVDFNHSQYRSFDVASLSRKELHELKSRLTLELQQIRQLKNRIESGEFQSQSNHNVHQTKVANQKLSGNKRPLPSDFGNGGRKPQLQSVSAWNPDLMKNCSQILTKLMKHKNGWIFNAPVDVVSLGLHDYYDIIKQPMDLGTVKSKMGKRFYASPSDFAMDVRLTFNNAMLYNPKGHDVHIMAGQLLTRFEEFFRPMSEKLEAEQRQEWRHQQQLEANLWTIREPEMEKIPLQTVRSPPVQSKVQPPPLPPVQSEIMTPEPMPTQPVKSLKQPKPRAKDPCKRDMSMEEKHRLGVDLQSLPQEKMEQVVQIVRKRNGHLPQDGDEIELDIETVDTETLWELDRLVTNWKKFVSKIRRQELMSNNNTGSIESNEMSPMIERIDIAADLKRQKKGEAEEEDVDIGDDMPISDFPAVEIEKDDGRGSCSSSSSSSSGSDSSSSDSDSGSSSGSDSDAENVQS